LQDNLFTKEKIASILSGEMRKIRKKVGQEPQTNNINEETK